MTLIHRILVLAVLNIVTSTSAMKYHTAAIQSVPPSVSLTPIQENQNTGNSIPDPINPFLTSSLLQALVEESESKKRVQRYRDVAK